MNVDGSNWLPLQVGIPSTTAAVSSVADYGEYEDLQLFTAEAVPEVGTLVGGLYRVVGELGRGAMGVVLLAEDVTLGRKVAIKFIRGDLLDEAFRSRFMTEAQAMARVNHPNTVQIHAYGEHKRVPYFVMELVSGISLDKWLIENGVPPVEVAVGMLGQVCAGVAAMHAADTVHRDIKPSNILIDASQRVRVADLGLAVLRGDAGLNTREIVGTPAYMAPEVAFPSPENAGFDERADVYSLGCVAYELLTGCPPFEAEHAMGLMLQHVTREPTPPSTLRADISPQLEEAVMRALAKKPIDRTPTVNAFREALEAAREGLSVPVRILIAEDSDDFRDVLGLALRDAFPRAVIDCVTDGQAALDAFEKKRPSVAILDLRMPELDGIELTRRLRERDPSASVPIIVLTGSGGPAEWNLLSAIGADRLLLKPVVLTDIVALIRRLLKDRVSVRPGSNPSQSPRP
jgi:eukaryotic-like serine/threonine-protein kinase